MKEKIKIIFQWLFDNWRVFVEIGIIYWAVNGIMKEYYSYGNGFLQLLPGPKEYHIAPVLAYFLSAVLILYLLRKRK